jgi:hypothetical protein
MQFSLHVFFALAALVFVVAAAVMGAQQGFATADPGGVPVCGSAREPCGASPGQFHTAANTIAR